MPRFRFLLLVLLVLFGVARDRASAQEVVPGIKIQPLAEVFETSKENQMMRAHLRTRAHAALDERRQSLEQLATKADIGEYQERLKSFFHETVDLDSFEPGGLRAKVTGRLERDGYSVEKVLFESLPGFHVTGNLYLPEGDGPFPGILHPCGHTSNGKAADIYQRVNILLVQNGFVVLCYDPIGQGERRQLIDPKTGKRLEGGTGEHHVLGVAPVLVGRGLSSYMIWDGIRGIDYLQSRPEVDPERIGCTGNSGGGNMTSYLMALDDRIDAAAPGCFMTTTRMKNESPGPGDPEQNLFAQTREGLDHPDFAIIRAPKPTLILAATKDFVPIEGTWDAFRQAKRVYTKLGYPECIDLVEAPEKHGYSQRLREGSVRFFARWLQGREIEVFEADEVAVEKEVDLLCTPKGQVVGLEGERSLFDLNREQMERWKEKREKSWASLDDKGKRDLVSSVTGISAIVSVPERRAGAIIEIGIGRGAHHTSEVIFETAPGIRIPVMRSYGRNHGAPLPRAAHLVCLDSRWESLHTPVSSIIPVDLPVGNEVVLINLPDSGFSKTKNWRFYGADQWIAYLLGTSYLAIRTESLISVARSLQEEGEGRQIHLHAEAEFVPVAIHAAALEPDLFASLTLHGGITTWETVIDSRDPVAHLHNVVHGALKHYDLSDLLALIPEKKVTLR